MNNVVSKSQIILLIINHSASVLYSFGGRKVLDGDKYVHGLFDDLLECIISRIFFHEVQ